MTFSDESVARFVNKNFVAAWESVAPVSLATFDLGNGKKLTGAYGGNIALYLCDSKGRVLDVLPALQTPTVTLRWLKQSWELVWRMKEIESDSRESALASFHARRADQPDLKPERVTDPLVRVLSKTGEASDGALKPRKAPLEEMAGKCMAVPKFKPPQEGPRKMGKADPVEGGKILVVVAGGLTPYTRQIDRFLGEGPLRTPEQCKKHVFETVLGEKLEGRKDVFVTDEPTSIAIPDED